MGNLCSDCMKGRRDGYITINGTSGNGGSRAGMARAGSGAAQGPPVTGRSAALLAQASSRPDQLGYGVGRYNQEQKKALEVAAKAKAHAQQAQAAAAAKAAARAFASGGGSAAAAAAGRPNDGRPARLPPEMQLAGARPGTNAMRAGGMRPNMTGGAAGAVGGMSGGGLAANGGVNGVGVGGGGATAGFSRAQPSVHAKYEMREVLGVGSTSTCYRCVERATGQAYACKVIDKRAIENKFRGLVEQFHVEIEVLKSLSHPNIIHMKAVFETDTKIHMVMELMSGGELFDYVVNKGTLSEEEASLMIRKVTSALAYMHSKGIIHRDLKPENLLLTSKEEGAEVKIIDFGLSKVLLENTAAKSFLGTRGYLAPEMLQRQSYSKAVDVWALGVLSFVLLCGCLPFDDDSSRLNRAAAVAKFQLRYPRWAQNLSPGAKDLLRRLLDVNPQTRLTAAQALEHPWVRGDTVKRNNYLESPRRLKRVGGDSGGGGGGGTGGGGGRGNGGGGDGQGGGGGGGAGGVVDAVQQVRQRDFDEQKREYEGGGHNGNGAATTSVRKNSV